MVVHYALGGGNGSRAGSGRNFARIAFQHSNARATAPGLLAGNLPRRGKGDDRRELL